MKRNRGFSLLLFLVYILFFSLISCAVLQMIVTCVIPSLHGTRLYRQQIAVYTGLDYFVHDIRSHYVTEWKQAEKDNIIFFCEDKDICWRYHQQNLERIEGIYDKKWQKRHKSVVLTNLKEAYFKIDYHNGRPMGIMLTIILKESPQIPIETYVAVRSYDNK